VSPVDWIGKSKPKVKKPTLRNKGWGTRQDSDPVNG